MTKRDLVFSTVEGTGDGSSVPAGFFLHFDPSYRRGKAAVDKHIEYFRYTGMDFLKIQYEHHFPPDPSITVPDDWRRVKKLDRDFFTDPLDVVRGIVNDAGSEAPVIVTLYSPFMLASQISSRELLKKHLEENPEPVKKGLEAVVESTLEFVNGCIEAGVDGFYASTQGGEAGFLADPVLFETYVRPSDLAVWDVLNAKCDFNILHVCDYEGPYTDLSPFTCYPGTVVNSALELTGGAVTSKEVSALFNRPFMGGMDRHGPLATGPLEAVRDDAESVLAVRPERFILGADCTVPGDTPWEHLKTAIDAAHNAGRS